jgi:protein-tyrosine phosphatase
MTGLVCGPYPGDSGIFHLQKEYGVSVSVNLQEPDETNHEGFRFHDYSDLIEVKRFPIRDASIPDDTMTTQIVSYLLERFLGGRPTYLHCWGGHGRTGTIVGCLLRQFGMGYLDALDHIRRVRSRQPSLLNEPSPQTAEQRRLVSRYKHLNCMPV